MRSPLDGTFKCMYIITGHYIEYTCIVYTQCIRLSYRNVIISFASVHMPLVGVAQILIAVDQ